VSGLLTEGACKPMGKLIGDATAVGSLRRPGIRIAIVWPGCGSADLWISRKAFFWKERDIDILARRLPSMAMIMWNQAGNWS